MYKIKDIMTGLVFLLITGLVINAGEQPSESKLNQSKIDDLIIKLISPESKIKGPVLKELETIRRDQVYQKQLEVYLLEKRGFCLERLVLEVKKRSKELEKLKKQKAELAKKREEAISALFGYHFTANLTSLVEGLDKSSEASAIHQLMFEVKKFYLAMPEVRLSREVAQSVLIVRAIENFFKSRDPTGWGEAEMLKIENEDVAGLVCLGRSIFRDWPLDEKERELFFYNQAADEFNRQIEIEPADESVRDLIKTWNEVREVFGLKKIKINLKLVKAARLHSQDMTRTGRFSDEEERFVIQAGYEGEMRGGCVALYKLRDPLPKMPLSFPPAGPLRSREGEVSEAGNAGPGAKLFDVWTIAERIHHKKLFFSSNFTEAGASGEESKLHHGQVWTLIVGVPPDPK